MQKAVLFWTFYSLILSCNKGSNSPSKVNGDGVWQFKHLQTIEREENAFTQGLIVTDGMFYESTGNWGASSMRAMDIESGVELNPLLLTTHVSNLIANYEITNLPNLDPDTTYFGEGMTKMEDYFYQLTWQGEIAFRYVYTPTSGFSEPEELPPVVFYGEPDSADTKEGWGLTHDQSSLIMSDGSSTISFRDPVDFSIERFIDVVDLEDNLVTRINELEYFDDKIYANVWQKNYVIEIDPETGQVERQIDFHPVEGGFFETVEWDEIVEDRDSVLNGIAYDQDTGLMYITGKNWPKIFAVEIEKSM